VLDDWWNNPTLVACAVVDGRPLAVGYQYGTIGVWDLRTRQRIGQFSTGVRDRATALACGSVDGHPLVVTGGQDRTVRIWHLTTGELVDVITLPGPAGALALAPIGDLVVGFGWELVVFARAAGARWGAAGAGLR